MRDEIIDKIKVVDLTTDGECSRCGECCGDYLPLLKNELQVIKEYVKKHNIKPYKTNVVMMNTDITCPFYDRKEKKCRIYEVRPSICRSFQCNLPFEEIKKVKHEHHNNMYRKPVSLRYEIFGEKNPFFEILNDVVSLIKE